jgi:hypothetical protein
MSQSPFDNYLTRNKLLILGLLGTGKDGDVLKTDRTSALKKLRTLELYRRELRAYKLLDELSIAELEGFSLPRLLGYDEEALLIEMTIVTPPYLLDFASTHDEVEMEFLAFTDEIWAEREQHWADVFGDQWPRVRTLRNTFLRLTGLTYLDPSKNNVRLPESLPR